MLPADSSRAVLARPEIAKQETKTRNKTKFKELVEAGGQQGPHGHHTGVRAVADFSQQVEIFSVSAGRR
jgi:hypothetical protein